MNTHDSRQSRYTNGNKFNSIIFITLIIRQIERNEINNVSLKHGVGNRFADRVQILSSNRARYPPHDTVDDSTGPCRYPFSREETNDSMDSIRLNIYRVLVKRKTNWKEYEE